MDVRIDRYTHATGVTQNQGRIIEKALRSGKRHFGSAGASLTWMNSPRMKKNLPEGWKPEVLDGALKAERDTSEKLLRWISDKPDAVLIDSMHIRGAGKEIVNEETGIIEEGDTDHILIIGNYILVIDTKNWKSKARYEVDEQGHIIRNKKSFPGGNVHMERALRMWLNYIDEPNSEISGAIYINNGDPDETRVFRSREWYKHYYSLLEESRALDWLNDKYENEIKPKNNGHINTNLVAQIAVCCVKPYNPLTGLINMDTVNNKFPQGK